MDRRHFLQTTLTASAATWLGSQHDAPALQEASQLGATRSVVPVVGDGTWIWQGPPATDRGYLERRPFRVKTGIEIEGTGSTSQVQATTPVPLAYAEQVIEDRQIETDGCVAQIRPITAGAAQLQLVAASLAKGQKITAYVHDRVELSKQYHAYSASTFPTQQAIPTEVRKNFLQDSPGIETRSKAVTTLAAELTAGVEHPWEQAQAFFAWVRGNIEPQIGPYTSVATALETRRGDCEEMAGVFVALCRSVNIPARLVWVPNHAWAEFYLTDHDGQGHWIPAHTACYSWFGFTGAHELVLQKGDRLSVPQRGRQLRLLDDWLRWSGSKPQVRYVAELTPEPATTGGDAGPGARRKDERGEWLLVGNHALDKLLRR